MDPKYLIESLLFVSGHHLSCKKIAEVLEISENNVKISLGELQEEYKKCNRGLRLVFLGDRVQLATAPGSAETVKKLIKSDFEEDLSPAALETLAIIAYQQAPMSRVEIENLRGVNCSFILQNLAIRGLVERKNNPQDGRSYVYNITFDFLKLLGLSRLEDLPQYAELKNSLGEHD